MVSLSNNKNKHKHPWKSTWNTIMNVWKTIFLFNWVIFTFHVNFLGWNPFSITCFLPSQVGFVLHKWIWGSGHPPRESPTFSMVLFHVISKSPNYPRKSNLAIKSTSWLSMDYSYNQPWSLQICSMQLFFEMLALLLGSSFYIRKIISSKDSKTRESSIV